MLRLLCFSILWFAVFPTFLALFFYYDDWKKIEYIFVLGLFLGLIAAPEIEPKVFKHPKFFQFLGGLFFGIVLSFMMGINLAQTVAIGIIGATLGLTASFWLKFLPWP